MRRLATLALLLLTCASARAVDQYARYNGSCQQGGQTITTNGVQSSQKVQQSYPTCTVTVYLHGTLTLATLFSDAAGAVPKANPFTATSTGLAAWYAADGRYDVQYSGTGITTPFTVSDIGLCFSCAGGTGTVTSVSSGGLTPLFTSNVATPTTTPAFSYVLSNAPAHEFFGNNTGSTGAPDYVSIGTGDLPFTYTGNTTKLVSSTGAVVNGNCAKWDASGNLIDNGAVCGGGGGGTPGTPVTTLQFNNSGSFAGASALNGASQATYNITTGVVDFPNQSNIRTVTPSFNWLQFPSGALTGGIPATVTLTPCPLGLDLTNTVAYGPFSARIATVGTAETVALTGGTCTDGAASGTVAFIPANSHSAGWSIGTAYGGIQEALNNTVGPNWKVIVPPVVGALNGYAIYAPIVIHQSKGTLEGYGAQLLCFTRSRCMQTGNLTNSNSFNHITVSGFRFRSGLQDSGCLITSTSQTAGVRTVNYTGSCTYQIGDWVRIDYTDDPVYWGDHVLTAASAGSVSWTQGSGNITSQTTPGAIALTNDAVMDNAGVTQWLDITNANLGSTSCVNPSHANTCQFNAFFDFWDDEEASVKSFDSDGVGITCNTIYCGSFIYSGGNVGPGLCTGGNCAPVIAIDNSNITAGCANGITSYNSNGIHVKNSVVQATGLWSVYVSNVNGNFQGALIDNMYTEVGCSGLTPFGSGSTGNGALIYTSATAASTLTVHGLTPTGKIPITGSGSTTFNYYIVGRDVTTGGITAPMLAQQTLNNQSGNITVSWPRLVPRGGTNSQAVTDTVNYDIIRTSGALHGVYTANGPIAGAGNCPGGSILACGSVATAQAQCAGLTCTFTDVGSNNTTAYTVVLNVIQSTFFPVLWYWPGDYVASVGAHTSHVYYNNIPTVINAVQSWRSGPQLFTTECSSQTENIWAGCIGDVQETAAPYSAATILLNQSVNSGAFTATPKGRLQFYTNSGAAKGGGALITLADSNQNKTMATVNHRQVLDALDTDIAIDNDNTTTYNNNAAQLALRSPVSISRYIANLPDNTGWKDRLTSTLYTLKVPVQLNGSSSGSAQIGVAAAAGTPNKILLPTATASANAVLVSDGASPQQTSWTLTPTLTSVTADTFNSTVANGGLSASEGTGASVPAGAGIDVMWPDSTAHRWKMNNNNGGAQNVLGANDWAAPGTIGSTTPSTGAFTTLSATGAITSTLATGTAPFTITSTTPVANLTTIPLTYNHSGTQQTATHLVQDSCTLGTDCGVTLTGSAVYTNATSYTCVCEDNTAINACRVNQTAGNGFTITGTGTDVIRYLCVGN